MQEFKVIILCNNPIAIPGLKEFLFYNKVGAVVTTWQNKEMQFLLTDLLAQSNVPLLLVNKKNYENEIIRIIQENEINVGLVFTFPFILTKSILNITTRGFYNFHFGLLPQCRGPQPILWHILNNDKECGVTLHKIDEGIDTGDIVLQEKVNINNADTYGILQSKMAHIGAKAAATFFKILSFGSIIPSSPQNNTNANYYKNPSAADLTIQWKVMNSDKIIRIINACNPWNKGAGSIYNNWMFGITEGEIINLKESDSKMPGEIIALDKDNGLLVKTLDNKVIKINIIYLQEGFLSGYRLKEFGLNVGNILA